MNNLRNLIKEALEELGEVEKTIKKDRIRYTIGKIAYADIDIIDETHWYLQMIESNKRGCGTKLMLYLIADAKNNGVKNITLHTSFMNKEDFFDCFGFKHIGMDDDDFLYYMSLNPYKFKKKNC